MNIYLARQPIFDTHMNVQAYELLYRRSDKNVFEGIDDNQATSELISNAFLSLQLKEVTSGAKAFINFSEDLIVAEVPQLLPKQDVVIEILERVRPTEEVVEACRSLKNLGYTLALDDFNYSDEFQPLIDLVDIIKIDYSDIHKSHNADLIKKYKDSKILLAEKVETREEYQCAVELGFSLFQGYFFSKPVMIKGQSLTSFNTTLLQVINEINLDEPDFQKVAEVIEKDVSVAHKILRLVNTLAFGSTTEIYSIKQALIRIGVKELRKWVYLAILQDFQSPETNELIKVSLVRAKMMELLAIEANLPNRFEFFMCGMFSSIDVLMNRPMANVLEDLPLATSIKKSLNGEDTLMREYLDIVIAYQKAEWLDQKNINKWATLEQDDSNLINRHITPLFIEAYKWASQI